jgi:RNA polymerase sigma factor for flagellar operon FliA
MKFKGKTASLNDYKRYALEAKILDDTEIRNWFADICAGKSPKSEVAEEILAIMQGRGLVRKTDFGWVLGAEGRRFARNLGLVPGPSKVEIDPSLVKNVKPKDEEEQEAASAELSSLEEVWATFAKTGSTKLRNLLMDHYLPLVKYTAERLHAKLPDKVDLDDLINAGIFGLMDAIDAYDPSRGVGFEEYCSPRIRGAILDELRSMDWVPRLLRARFHQFTKASQSLEAVLGRKPTEKETAEELNMDMEEFARFKRDATAVSVLSLDNGGEGEKDVREIDIIKDGKNLDPLIEAQKRALENLLTKGLTREERLIIVCYYYEEMTMKEIGATLDLSESRVSQMHSSIVARLKAQMSDRKEELST